METTTDLNKFLKQVAKARKEIKYNRADFWNKNKVNFKNNIKTLISCFKFPEGWNVSTIASRFLLDKPSMPYDEDVWSFSDIVAATKDQGYELILFFNKTDLEFLSLPGLLQIVVHESAHVYQAAKDPKSYVQLTVNEELNKISEQEAEAEVKKFSDEFRKEEILEKIMYCYDLESWKGAKKMVNYLYNETAKAYGGGYDRDMTEEEYKKFKEAEEEKDIDMFIDYFIDSLKEIEEAPDFIGKLTNIFKKKE